MSVKGKGLLPEELEIFNKNEEIFCSNFFKYFKALSLPHEREFAQLRRKYQSSFVQQEDYCAVFQHRFSNPNEFCESLCRSVRKTGLLQVIIRVPENFEEIGCDVIVVNGDFADDHRTCFEEEIKKLTVQFKSPFQALKYLDNHIQQISSEVYSSVQNRKSQDRQTALQKLLEQSKKARSLVKALPKPELTPLHPEVHPKEPEEQPKAPQEHPQEHPNTQSIEPDSNKQDKKTETFRSNIQIPTTYLNISAKQLTFRELGSCYFTSISTELTCVRCEARHFLKSSLSESGLAVGDNYFTEDLSCGCTLPLSFKITALMIFQKSGRKVATGKFHGCSIIDIPSFDLKFTCPDCGEFASLFSGKAYTPYIITCQSCFSKGTFQLDGFEFAESKPASEEEKKTGKPLPKNGTCKHFKNSFRWFKFPCCQRVFPCMICHDDNTDHPSQRSQLYVCGFCGELQKCSNKNLCKKCGGNINGADSDKRFWEGGKGCRNTDRMSKNDKKKFKKNK